MLNYTKKGEKFSFSMQLCLTLTCFIVLLIFPNMPTCCFTRIGWSTIWLSIECLLLDRWISIQRKQIIFSESEQVWRNTTIQAWRHFVTLVLIYGWTYQEKIKTWPDYVAEGLWSPDHHTYICFIFQIYCYNNLHSYGTALITWLWGFVFIQTQEH